MWSNTIAAVNCVLLILFIQEVETTKEDFENTVKVCVVCTCVCSYVFQKKVKYTVINSCYNTVDGIMYINL